MTAKKSSLTIPQGLNVMTGVLDEGCEFEGKLAFQGSVRIGGVFKGEIYTPDTLIVSETAKVQGSIEAGVVIVGGEVNANIKARHRVEIHAPAVFRGQIITPSLQVGDGVVFEGSSKMIQTPDN